MRYERFSWTAIGASLVICAGSAHAYELQVTPAGQPVRWQVDEVAWDVSGLAAAPQARGAVLAAARRALDTWSAAGGPVLVEGAGAVASIRWATDPDDPGVDPDVLAETHLAFDTDTGELLRAEIVVNGAGFRWAAGDGGCSDAFDLESTLAHELGHALGLKHSAVADATMFTHPSPCARDRRDLAADDVAAIDALYTAPLTDPDADRPAIGGCSAASGRSSAAMLLLLLAAATLARSRRFLRRIE